MGYWHIRGYSQQDIEEEMTKVLPLSLRRRLALEIWRKGFDRKIKEHPLRQLFWECTLRCNLHCRHCGSDCKTQAGITDMPKEDFLRVLDRISEVTAPHNVFVIVTGGEPLMRDDIAECCRAIYDRGFPWGMVTNALRLTPDRFRSLLDAGLHAMTVSLDGLEDNHNWMRGNKSSFQMVSRAIDMLVAHEKEIVFDVLTCVNRRNYSELKLLRSYLIGKGVKRWRIVAVFPVGRAASDPDMHLTSEEYRGILDFIKQIREEGIIRASYGCEGFMGNYEGDIRDYFFGCQAGVTVGSVLVDGSISACASIRFNFNQGNIYQDDFMDVWLNKFQPYRNREWMRKGECADCKYFRYCRGNGMHLRDDDGNLIVCPLHRLVR